MKSTSELLFPVLIALVNLPRSIEHHQNMKILGKKWNNQAAEVHRDIQCWHMEVYPWDLRPSLTRNDRGHRHKRKNSPYFLQGRGTARLPDNAGGKLLRKPKQHSPLFSYENLKKQQPNKWHRRWPHNCEQFFYPCDKRNKRN